MNESETIGTPANTEIVEGVMRQVLLELGRKYWNCNQKSWGLWGNAPYFAIKWNSIDITIEEFHDDSCVDTMMHLDFDGARISTWLDSKREFYDAHAPNGWGNVQFVEWADRLFKEIGS